RYFPSREPLPAPRPSTPKENLDQYAGSYRFVRMNYTDVDKVIWLFQPTIRVSALANGCLLVSSPLDRDGRQYAPVDSDLFQEVGGARRIAFRSEGGKVTRIFFDDAPYQGTERIPWDEVPSLWYGVLLAAVVLLGSTVPGPFTRRT